LPLLPADRMAVEGDTSDVDVAAQLESGSEPPKPSVNFGLAQS
jgi:hypothetical protein